jgi:hypothetical protein
VVLLIDAQELRFLPRWERFSKQIEYQRWREEQRLLARMEYRKDYRIAVSALNKQKRLCVRGITLDKNHDIKFHYFVTKRGEVSESFNVCPRRGRPSPRQIEEEML